MRIAKHLICCLASLILFANASFAQSESKNIRGTVSDQVGKAIVGSTVLCACSNDAATVQDVTCTGKGDFLFSDLLFACEQYVLIATANGFQNDTIYINQEEPGTSIRFLLHPILIPLKEARVAEDAELSIGAMNSLQAGGLYRGIKSAVLQPEKSLGLGGETQARNIFIGIPSANIWESDAAGLQLGIGVRGLSPNRSAHISIRQGNHPIAADPLGYPEAYYTPPLNMVKDIRLTTGATALQYGSQLGGMMNFRLRSGDWETP